MKEFRGQYNPANKEWYCPYELYNMTIIANFIKENGFEEGREEKENPVPKNNKKKIITEEEVVAFLEDIGFNKKPRDYQVSNIAYQINNGNCINGSDTGLGKTLQTIAYAEILDLFPCLVVCPDTVKSGWEREWGECFPERSVSIISSTKKENSFKEDVIVINYDILAQRNTDKTKIKFPELLKKKFKLVVADEFHLLKERTSLRSKGFKKIIKNIPNILGLTGTMVLNRPKELINLLKLLGRFDDLFPDSNYYNNRYCNARNTEYGWDLSGSSNIKELSKILREFCYIRVEKRDVLTELPPLIETYIDVDITNNMSYKRAEKDLIEYLEKIDIEKAENAERAPTLVKLSTLKQLSIKGKLFGITKAIKEWQECNEGKNLLVFGIHKEPLQELHKKFKGSFLITGDLNYEEKEDQKNQFINTKGSILFANMKTIGTGVDGLQKVCSDMMVIELPQTPGELDQVIGRIERYGQENIMNLIYVSSPRTIDVHMKAFLDEKRKITDIINKGKADEDIDVKLIRFYKNGR